jgi:hypothetical protein
LGNDSETWFVKGNDYLEHFLDKTLFGIDYGIASGANYPIIPTKRFGDKQLGVISRHKHFSQMNYEQKLQKAYPSHLYIIFA